MVRIGPESKLGGAFGGGGGAHGALLNSPDTRTDGGEAFCGRLVESNC